MSTATNTPLPDPDRDEQRPDLHVVRNDHEPASEPDTDMGTGTSVVPVETTTEVTGPVPVLDADGNPVPAHAPLDVRIRTGALAFVRGVPAFGQVPASFRESLYYSQCGDWATSENGGKRVVHGLCTVVAYLATYPLVEGLGKAREKPVGLIVTLALLTALIHTLALLI